MTTTEIQKLVEHYSIPDPWGFQSHPDDAERKRIILASLEARRFRNSLDYGCGEGWITGALPVDEIYGWDLIPAAMARLPKNVKPWNTVAPNKFELVVATGVLYPWYNGIETIDRLRAVANGTILTCHMAHQECQEVINLGRLLTTITFPYREMTEILRIFTTS